MAGDTLATRRARLAELIGIPRSQTIPSDLQTQLNGYVEDAIRQITRSHEWGFMRGYERLEIEAAYTTGTVSVAAGGTAVTGSGTTFPTTWAGEAYAEMRIGGETYRVASIDSSTGITLTDASLTAHSGVTYVLYKAKYLMATVKGIESIAPAGGGRNDLKNCGIELMRSMKSNQWSIRHPQFWATHSYVSGMPLIELYPIPYANEILHVYGMKAPTIPSTDGGTDDIPDDWSEVVDLWAQERMFFAMEDKRHQTAFQRAQSALMRMMQEADANRDGLKFELDPKVYGNPRESYPYGGYMD